MKRGFTLIELVVVMGLLIAIGSVVLVNIAGRRTNTDLMVVTRQIATLLRQAQVDAMSQKNGAVWGVRFANNTSSPEFFALFSGSYATGTIAGQYVLPSSVTYTTSTVASGGTVDITFAQVSGTASASTSIGLYMPNENSAFSSTIYIASSGAVTF